MIKTDPYADLWPCQIDVETGETRTGKNDSAELSRSTFQCDDRLGSSLAENSDGGGPCGSGASASAGVCKEAEERFCPLKIALEAIYAAHTNDGVWSHWYILPNTALTNVFSGNCRRREKVEGLLTRIVKPELENISIRVRVT